MTAQVNQQRKGSGAKVLTSLLPTTFFVILSFIPHYIISYIAVWRVSFSRCCGK